MTNVLEILNDVIMNAFNYGNEIYHHFMISLSQFQEFYQLLNYAIQEKMKQGEEIYNKFLNFVITKDKNGWEKIWNFILLDEDTHLE